MDVLSLSLTTGSGILVTGRSIVCGGVVPGSAEEEEVEKKYITFYKSLDVMGEKFLIGSNFYWLLNRIPTQATQGKFPFLNKPTPPVSCGVLLTEKY